MSLAGLHMGAPSEMDRFQRWLQSELAEASLIEDKKDSERRVIQIDIAISEAVRYRDLVSRLDQAVSSPFVERESAVRISSNNEVKPTSISGECHACGATKNSDIEFCPVCGEF